MQLEPVGVMQATLDPAQEVGPGPYGVRLVIPITGGTIEGERLRGTFAFGGADRILVDPTGHAHLSARATLLTHDEVLVYVEYDGVLEMNDAVGGAMSGDGTTEYGDAYWFTRLAMESADPRYSWVNTSVFVAEGRILKGASLEYTIYRLTH